MNRNPMTTVVLYALANQLDPVQALADYLAEKDSRLGRSWCEWKVRAIVAREGAPSSAQEITGLEEQ